MPEGPLAWTLVDNDNLARPCAARREGSIVIGVVGDRESTHSYPVPAIVAYRLCSPENVTGCEKTEFGALVKKLKWHGNTG
jgi:hypothetical protein